MQNEMMHRPVVKAELVDYMRSQQKSLTGKLNIIEKDANKRGVPIIPHETVVFMEFLLGQIKPQQVLEIGTAIGFSASLMAQYVGDKGHVTTIDRFDKMIAEAKETFRFLELEDKITLLEGQAADILPTLKGSYDFIFMDSAKSKYIEFLPDCLRLLKKEGVLMIDDVFQGGTILQDEKEIPRGKRGIHKKLNQFLDTVNQHPDLASSLLPLGDGVMLITKKADEVVL